MIKEYVLGLAFSENRKNLVLIRKQRPEWQKGSLNGIGGKLESFDLETIDAMVREFQEETGVETLPQMWQHFATMTFRDDILGGTALVYCYKMFSDLIYRCHTIEEEEIIIFDIDDDTPPSESYSKLWGQKLIKNLFVLLPAALDDDFKFCDFEIK